MSFEGLDPELQQKVKACQTPEEIIKLAAQEGYELSDDEIEAISGGGGSWDPSEDCSKFRKRSPHHF